MSAAPDLTTPPRPVTGRPPSPFAVPWHALQLLARCGIGLVLWFAAGELARFGLLYLGTEISHGDYRQVRLVLTTLILTFVVAANLIVIVGMLHTLRGALAEFRARRAQGYADERFLLALDRSAPVFVVIYLTWGLVNEDALAFIRLDTLHRVEEPLTAALAGTESTAGRGLIDMDVRVSAVLMTVAWVVKLIYGRMFANGQGRFSGSLAAFAELCFFLFGINATITLIEERSDWLAHRSVVVGAGDLMARAGEQIPGWAPLWEWAGENRPYIAEALILPLLWLAVAILVYGADVSDTRAAFRGTPLDAAAAGFDRAHSLTRTLVSKVTTGLQDRWIPIVHALRLTVRGGAALFGVFCLCHVGLRIAVRYGERWVSHLIGSEEPYLWIVIGQPVTMAADLVVTVLTMCLLAATFDIAATRVRALRGAGEPAVSA